MSNHIAVKFIGISYSQVPKESFLENLPRLIELFRKKLPRFETPDVNDITVNVSDNNIETQKLDKGKELYLVDAVGNFAVKIGNQGLSISTAKYVEYDQLLEFFKWVTGEVVDVLKVSHFSRLSLRNINLFRESEGQVDEFEDIRDESYWGKQAFNTLNDAFFCSGAATRHEYLSSDYQQHININSGVVLPLHNQSYIPQEEWGMWKLRGVIPTLDKVHLLIDIAATSFVSPVNKPELQNNVIEFDWTIVHTKMNKLHNLIANVYSDITKDD